ncbi:pyruvate dehydrogenase E2 component (dihydrolipoamide acetyltransferase) [Rhodoligotrophos appendicifer]|uniref:pyruvate dehydrogenase complex dihydrolipoamide acetyltransferase n=1 Tax=Rhodoligotrophos appendicifer TaxID=987056 RepID=UPI001185C7EC|nr:pyruvate dehydrogenase complex dihydrolipoamide acetyltransferase [Rhodoligotrophos appendicifer]
MPTPILMPALSPTMEEGKLAKWLVKEGDKIASGDVIAEIETDKATMEVEAVDEGTMGKILVPAGTEGVKVNAEIAVLLGEGEKAADIAASVGGKSQSKAAPSAAPVKEPVQRTPPPEEDAKPAPQAAPREERRTQTAATEAKGERIFASPLARRLAKEAGIDLGSIVGSGPHGRVVQADVEKTKTETPTATTAAAAAQPAQAPKLAAAMPDAEIRKFFADDSYEIVPHDGMRKVIARRLTQSKQTIPHFYLTLDCVIDGLLETRQRLNDRAPTDKDGKPSYKISVNDFVIKAMGQALQMVPEANVTWTDEGMLKHRRSDVGVAVAIPGGLITPVVRQVETKGLAAISNEMKDYAVRARARKLMPDEYQGGTTAISNLGMYGIKDFAAVINPPHATILAVGAGEKRPVVLDDTIVIRSVMSLTLSTDHRAVDGALGAELLQAIKSLIEEPAMMLV